MATFSTLWSKFPDPNAMKKLCVNKQKHSQSPFGNYCAINLSECFNRSGIFVNQAPGRKCWSHKGAHHLLLAEDFARWLNLARPAGFGKTENIAPRDFQSTLEGKRGVVFFKDYWRRGTEAEANRSGDHIDLWNKDEITSSSMMWRGVIEFLGLVSDLNASKKIWFWEVK